MKADDWVAGLRLDYDECVAGLGPKLRYACGGNTDDERAHADMHMASALRADRIRLLRLLEQAVHECTEQCYPHGGRERHVPPPCGSSGPGKHQVCVRLAGHEGRHKANIDPRRRW